jgi:AraC-like DNA-binding protein
MDSPGQSPGIDAVAHRLHLSIRTLRRRLADQRTSFREIDREIRHTLALEYLQETNLPIKQVADLVGFENPANFTRAFQRWAGHSPRRSRQK